MSNGRERVFYGIFLVQGILNYSYSVNLVPVGLCKEVGLFEDFTSQDITRPKYEDASDRW